MHYLTERITIDPDICSGKPTIRGMHITVQAVLEYLAAGDTKEKILEKHPLLEAEDIIASINFMDKIVRKELDVDFWGVVNAVQEDLPEYKRIIRIWKPVEFDEAWQNSDTSILDDISDSWFNRRKSLVENSIEYINFLGRLKREHAIETGIVERMYDLSRNITETLIKEGFDSAYLSHDDSNIPTPTLLKHLNDHLEAVDFVFDIVKEERPLSISFIKQLHQLVTRHQSFAEGRDQFGNRLKIRLLRGEFKIRENNPTREDGTLVMYCPPEHVAAEMDSLVRIFNQLVKNKIHPLLIATWFHHAFTTIHPFQDGNGRVARLLASLIFIKFELFPFTVLREEAKSKYIEGLEAADKGNPQIIVNYFANVQKRNIQNALNIKEVGSTSLAEVQSVLIQKLKETRERAEEQYQQVLAESRRRVFLYCDTMLVDFSKKMQKKLGKSAEISISKCPFEDDRLNEKGFKITDYFFKEIVSYAKLHNYFFNRNLPKSWISFKIQVSQDRRYQLVFTLHHYGYHDATLAIGAFFQLRNFDDESLDSTIPLPIPPHVISIDGDIISKEKNIKQYLENALTLALAQIASEL